MHWLPLIVFLVAYAGFVAFPLRRWLVCLGGVAALLILGVVGPGEAFRHIDWSVLGIFVGTAVIADLMIQSNAPAFMAARIVARTRHARLAMLAICALSGVVSVAAENVATVLLIAPIAVAVAVQIGVSPVPLMIGVAICSNLQGAATLIGDPPSMILASHTGMRFDDFFFFDGKPGIFFAVQIGALAGCFVLAWAFRRYTNAIEIESEASVTSWFPTGLMGAMILVLVVIGLLPGGSLALSGQACVVIGAVGIAWHVGTRRPMRELNKSFDLETSVFLAGVFILVGSVTEAGWIDWIADRMVSLTGASDLAAFSLLVGFSILVSAFVDNVPYLMAMLPVAQQLAVSTGRPPELLLYGLLIGASVGGNITPVGASANIVTVGYLKRIGHTVGFWEFIKLGLPFTLVSVAAASTFLWLVWG